MRLGVLGGAFDPPHNAHLVLARLALEQLELDRVLFVVAGTHPLKRGTYMAPAADRLRMVELAIGGVADFVADGRELGRPGPSYTVDTLHELAGEQPTSQLVLLIGADVARGFAEWHDPAGVRSLAQIAVCARGGEAIPAGFDAEVRMPVLELSSTAIRGRAAAGRSLAGWVPREVADYIVASNFYRSNAG